MTIVADAGVVSAANQQAIEAAGSGDPVLPTPLGDPARCAPLEYVGGRVLPSAIRPSRGVFVGSFTELQLSFHFRTDVPTEVLATFAPLYQATTPTIQGPAPELPMFLPASDDDWWMPDWKECYGPGRLDPYASEPWRHEWAPWLAGSMSVGTVPTAALVWSELKRWHFSCRSSFKTWPGAIFDALGWLGPFIEAYDNPVNPRPTLVGHMTYESSGRPYLLWCQYGQLRMENLNGPDDEWG